ncbi:MAG: BatA domain-containing protein [Proteobacteria bacterium]|nr:BatA domain-containing protein [Pseudomonadota bacterium]
MSVTLLAPLGLAALAALALPLLIHLVRRLELQTTEFAALRWIAARMRPQRHLRLERLWLLLIRLLLLAAMALLLARPVWRGEAPAARPWIAVAPGVALADARAVVHAVGGEWHWLAPGFPSIEQSVDGRDLPLASLLRELDAELPMASALTVVVPEKITGLDGERVRLSRKVDWLTVPGSMAEASARSSPPIRLAVRYAPDAEPSLRYLRAAVAAWNRDEPGRHTLDAQPVDAPIAAATDGLIWLAPPAPTLTHWLDAGGIALTTQDVSGDGEVLWRDANGVALARSVRRGSGRVIALPGALVPADLPLLLDADFPQRLRQALAGDNPAPTAAMASEAMPHVDTTLAALATSEPGSLRPLDTWLVVLIAGLFLLERILATWPRAEREK